MWLKAIILLMGTIIYRMNWQGASPENIDAYIDITDMESYVEGSDPEYRMLDGIGMKIEKLRVDDVHDPIYSRRLVFSFRNTNNEYLHTFSQGDDRRWRVKFWYRWFEPIPETYDVHEVFHGYLNLDDMSEPYLPKGHPVTLTANDGLAELRNIDLVNFADEKPTGKQNLKDIVCWILRKTGTERYVYIIDNLFEINHDYRETLSWKCPWAQTFVDMLTFEGNEINSIMNCYDVLDLILRARQCRLLFYDGGWWVQRIDELRNPLQHYTQYNPGGTVSAGYTNIPLNKQISPLPPTGPDDRVVFVNATSTTRLKRGRRTVDLVADYNFPLEIVCNINFERGDFNAPATTDPDEPAFNTECWTVKRGLGSSATTASTTAIIRRILEDGYEKERFAILFNPGSGSTAPLNYLESEAVELGEKDKFDFGFDYRWNTDAASGASLSEALAMLRLEGDDGTHWLLDDDGKWYQSDVNWTTNLKTIDINWVPDDVDERLWRTASVTCQPAPVTGKLYIMLFTHNQNGTGLDDVDTYFDNVKFDYRPFINGGYANYVGERHRVSIVDDKNYKEERPLQLFDSPRKNFKGAMFWNDGGVYKLTTKWDDRALVIAAIPAVGETRIGKWLSWALWDMYRRQMNILECDFRGMEISSKVYSGGLHTVQVNGNTPATQNKKFLVMPVEQDWYRMTWRCIIFEINDFVLDEFRDYGASGAEYSFKYLSR